jgi:hypothetical protein
MDATIDDLQLQRLLEPARGIHLSYRAAERHAQSSATTPAGRRERPQGALPVPAAEAAPSAAAELLSAVAPLAAFAIGAKLGNSMFGPRKRD